jgi:hypothetical protein
MPHHQVESGIATTPKAVVIELSALNHKASAQEVKASAPRQTAKLKLDIYETSLYNLDS